MKIYTGIGARKTPKHDLSFITRLAARLAANHWALRSGGAAGADSAFAAGVGSGLKCIYRPEDATPEALSMAERFHPAWHKCSPVARLLHARNCFQILGRDLATPTLMVICWTKGGAGHGGTGQAIRIARASNIPVFDLGGDRAEAIKGIADMVAAVK